LEAASRGADEVVFVEKDRHSLIALERNLAAFRQGREIPATLRVQRGDVFAQLASLAGNGFTLVFADPPYGDAAQRLVDDPRVPAVLAADGWLVLESAARDALLPGGSWQTEREAVYGDTRVSFFSRGTSGGYSGSGTVVERASRPFICNTAD
jgi:16S rRNA G966 N2-methylase RsmD